MPKIKFRTQGTSPASGRINEPGGGMKQYPSGGSPDPGAAILSIELDRTEGTAPCAVFIQASLTNADVDRTYTDPVYKWSFDDPGTFSHLDADFFWRDKNVAWGPLTMHTYHPSDFGGADYIDKTITCECRLRNRTTGEIEGYTETVTFRVHNPDVVFAGTKTVCYSSTGDFTNAPSGAQQFTDYNNAVSAVDGQAVARLLVQGGQSYDNSTWNGLSSTNAQIRHIGTYGGRATINSPYGGKGFTWSRTFQFADEVALFGFTMNGPYDPTDPYSVSSKNGVPNAIDIRAGSKTANPDLETTCRYTVTDMSMTGYNVGVNPENTASRISIFDCRVDGWLNYGVYQGRGWDYFAVRGLSVKQPIGTVTGDATKTEDAAPIVADHGPGRITSPPFRLVLQNVDIRSLNSWGGGSADIQPSWRHAGRPVDHPYSLPDGETAFYSTSCIRTEVAGGLFGYGAAIGEGNQEAEGVAWVAEMFYQVIWTGAQRPLGAKAPGQTIRNGLIVFADTPEDDSGRQVAQITELGDSDSFWAADYAAYPLRFYNITVVDLRTNFPSGSLENGQIAWFTSGDPTLYGEYTSQNHVMYGPHWTDIGDASDSFDMSSIWTPHMTGHYRLETYPAATYSVPFAAEDAPAAIPLDGSSAKGGANTSHYWALNDIWGNWRDPSAPSRGAVEPNTTA